MKDGPGVIRLATPSVECTQAQAHCPLSDDTVADALWVLSTIKYSIPHGRSLTQDEDLLGACKAKVRALGASPVRFTVLD